jgi:hypothetical protein
VRSSFSYLPREMKGALLGRTGLSRFIERHEERHRYVAALAAAVVGAGLGVCRDMRKRALLLTTVALAVAIVSGTALAEEKENGLIYYGTGGLYSIDPAVSNPQYTVIFRDSSINSFDLSPDRQTAVYVKGYGCCGPIYPFYIRSLSSDPYFDDSTEIQIKNKRDGTIQMRDPRFSRDGQTIYFTGKQVLASDTDDNYHLYSVPTEGGEATKIPINQDANNSLIFAYFALSHDGTKFAIGGSGGIYTAPVGGGDATKITNDGCKGTYYPNFSPDDQTIIYNAAIYSGGDDCSGTGHTTIYTTPAYGDGTSAGTPLFPEDATDAYPGYMLARWYPSYSPDGKSIAFAHWYPVTTYTTYKLAIAPAGGGSVTHIANCVSCKPLWVEKNPPPFPETYIDSGPWDYPPSTTATFAFSSSDTESTFQCKLDNGAYEGCTSPHTYTDLSEGDHTFKVKATNSMGTDLTPDIYDWIVDTIPPDTSITNGPDDGSTLDTDSATFDFSSNEGGSWFKCRLDSTSENAWSYCTSPKGYTGLNNGSHTFEVKAIDQLGNEDSTPASRTWSVDRPPPDTTIEDPPEGYTFTNDPVRISFTSSQSDSTFECSMDSGNWSACGSNANGSWHYEEYTGLANGSHNIKVRATNTGGTDSSPASLNFTVGRDATAPAVSLTAPANGSYLRSTVQLIATASDNVGVKEVRFFVNGSQVGAADTTAPYSVSWNSATGPDGKKTITAQAFDAAGNKTTSASRTVTVDNKKPTVTSTTPTNNATGVKRNTNNTVAFSEAMNKTTLTTSTFKLYKCASATDTACTTQITNVKVAPSTDGRSATLNPYGATSTVLQASTKYKVVVTTGAKDLTGNPLAQQKVTYFKTGKS